MKKILALVSLLLVASPAFGATIVTYDVKLQGDNHAADWANGDVVLYTPGSNAEGVEYGTDAANGKIVNWSVDAIASVDGGDNLVYGVANAVFDLELSKDGSLVATFGLGGPDAAGFFSTILDGDQDAGQAQADELKAAAFTWVFNVPDGGTADPGRLFDPRSANGPNLNQHTYPSTLGFPAGSTALGGTLVGMGAGYTSYQGPFIAGPDTAGVGLSVQFGPPGPTTCDGLGIGPIAEGQLNVQSLENGTYTLKVVAGAGNNVLKNPGDVYCDEGTTGNFAAKADQAVGDQITFLVNNVIEGCLTPRQMVSAVSRKVYGGVNRDINLPSTGNVGVENRFSTSAGQVSQTIMQIVVTYDGAIGGMPVVGLSAGAAGAVSISGTELSIPITGVPDGTCLTVTIDGVTCDDNANQITPTHTVKARAIAGDVNGSGAVNSADIAIVKASSGVADQETIIANQPVWRMDLNSSGSVNSTDIALVKSRSGVTSAQPCTN